VLNPQHHNTKLEARVEAGKRRIIVREVARELG
jgi:hypothetical protein